MLGVFGNSIFPKYFSDKSVERDEIIGYWSRYTKSRRSTILRTRRVAHPAVMELHAAFRAARDTGNVVTPSKPGTPASLATIVQTGTSNASARVPGGGIRMR